MNITTLLVLLSVTLAACGSGLDPAEIAPELVTPTAATPAAAPTITCGILEEDAANTERLFQLVPANSPNPDPAHCTDYKNGMWYCTAICLPGTYAPQTSPVAQACPVCGQ